MSKGTTGRMDQNGLHNLISHFHAVTQGRQTDLAAGDLRHVYQAM